MYIDNAFYALGITIHIDGVKEEHHEKITKKINDWLSDCQLDSKDFILLSDFRSGKLKGYPSGEEVFHDFLPRYIRFNIVCIKHVDIKTTAEDLKLYIECFIDEVDNDKITVRYSDVNVSTARIDKNGGEV